MKLTTSFAILISSALRRVVLIGLLITGAPAFPAEPVRASNPDLFDSNRVLKVQITLAPADWEKLRNQERDAKAEFSKDRLERPVAKPYTWFTADVTLDGVPLKKVGIRKRGFFGSSDKDRPALNLELDKFVKGQKFAGGNALKLHNNKQDGTNVRQPLAYQLFTAAGVPAPRCSLAHVTVNGKDLGVYSSLESIDDAFLKRQFGNEKGNLYEAQISDFRPGWTRTFEKKNNPTQTSLQDLEAVVQALQSDDAQLLERLGRVLDLDAFISFWAMESLINHWDGFAGDLNNCFVYHDPKSDKLRFIAWGADATFGSHHIFVPFEPPASVWAVSFLTRRLYNHPVTQEKYRKRLKELLATVWNEKTLLAEVDRLEKLAKGLSTVSVWQAGAELEQLKQFIRSRRSAVEDELQQPAQAWTHPMRKEFYSTVIGKISGNFSSAWVPNVFSPAPAGAKARITLDFYGRQLVGDFTDVKAMPDPQNPRNAAVLFNGGFPGVNVPISIWMSTSTNLFQKGKTLHSGTESILLLVAGQLGKKDFRILGFWEGGKIVFKDAGMQSDAKVQGTLDAEVTSTPWEDFDLKNLKKAR